MTLDARARLTSLLPTPYARLAALAFVATTVAHLLMQLNGLILLVSFWNAQVLAQITFMLLMPTLGLTVWAASLPVEGRRRPRAVRWVLAALGLSWMGDTLPFLAASSGLGLYLMFFVLVLACYAAAFWPYRSRSALASPVGLVPYGALVVGLVVVCAPVAGPWTVPVGIFALALAAMSVLAWGVGRLAGIGGLLLLVSEVLRMLMTFTTLLSVVPADLSGFALTASYVVGQALLAVGVLRATR
ncbi:lysoplasmalogenase family protein [Antribacter gilvus]|uniref:lysoplasmalogenase family protein n=1 Tax=Antribacter gilvus TaxID=2304675 RepID=UPI000F79C73B|nr:lysoplasmalogenase family protein [Antribacter gilvus]